MKNRTLALVLAALMLLASFAGCGENAETDSSAVQDPAASAKSEEHKVNGRFRNYFTTCPTTLDQNVTSALESSNIAVLCEPVLYDDRINDTATGRKFVCELASEFPKQVDDEGKVWNIGIRDDYKWANGELITVDDVVYSMQMRLDPKLLNVTAPAFTNNIYASIVNDNEYMTGQVEWDKVGWQKLDDSTLQITVEEPSTEFKIITLCTRLRLVYKPLFEQCMLEDRTATTYGTSLDTFMSGGPFILTEWIPDAKISLDRNPDYIHADEINIEGIDYVVVPNAATALEMFIKGDLDYCTIAYTDWEAYEDDPRVYEYYNDSLMYYFVNIGNPSNNGMLGNLDFRKALYYGTDRVAIANTIDAHPITRIVRRSVVGDPNTLAPFVEMPGSNDYIDDPNTVFDVVKANEHLSKAYEACGLTSANMEIMHSESGTHTKGCIEIMQSQYNKNFEGKLNVSLRQVPSTQILSLRRWNPDDPTSFETTVGSLLPDGSDPRATFNFYRSDYSPPRVKYANPEYDALLDESYGYDFFTDTDKVVECCQKLEKILIDDLVVVPIYEIPTKVLFSERVQLPAGKYVNGYGFGTTYMTIKD